FVLSPILRSSPTTLNSLGSSASVELPLRRVAKSMRPVGAQSRLTTPLAAVCFSSLHLQVSNLGKYVNTLAFFFSFSKSAGKRAPRPLWHLRDQITYSPSRPTRR